MSQILNRHWLVAGELVAITAPESMMQMLAPLLALYPDGSTGTPTPSIAFSITRQGDRWRLDSNGIALWQDVDGGNIIAALELSLYRQVVAAIMPALCSIHAAAVANSDGTVLFAGISGAGKSSLCTRFLLAKWHYLSDEFSLLAEDGTIHPFPRPLQWECLTHPAFTHEKMLGSGCFTRGFYQFIDQQGAPRTSQLWLPNLVAQRPSRLRMVVLPRYDPNAQHSMVPVVRSVAISELATLLQQPIGLSDAIQTLHHRLPRDCRFMRLTFRDVHQVTIDCAP
ncbi:MAG: hypothetical protein Q9M26_02390 [Mariprofundales bacterium]|nr:hypothetical protein [Mariprofundales bacterium]